MRGHQRKKSQPIDVKLVTNQDQLETLNYNIQQGFQPPSNTPMTPGQPSPWRSIIIDELASVQWDSEPNQQDQINMIFKRKYPMDFLKEYIELDFTNILDFKFKRLFNRRCCGNILRSQWIRIQLTPNKQSGQQLQNDTQQILFRKYEDPTIQQKKDEIREHTKWLKVQKQKDSVIDQFQKELKFRLNQLAPQNYQVISQSIVELIEQKFDYFNNALKTMIEKAAFEDKYRNLYSQLISFIGLKYKAKIKVKDIIKQNLTQLDYSQISNETYGMNSNDELIYNTKRKKKFIGNAKLVSLLYLELFFDDQFLDEIIFKFLQRFLIQYNKPNQNNTIQKLYEELLEGILALLSLCGQEYLGGGDDSKQNQFIDIISQQTVPNEQIHLNLKGILKLFDCLLNGYQLSQRLTMLIQNKREELQNIRSDRPLKKANSQIESDEEIYLFEQKKIQQQNLQRIQEVDEEQPLSSKKPLKDKDIILIIDQYFKNHTEDLTSQIQLNVMNRLINLYQWNLFWENYFANLLNINPTNFRRADVAYILYNPYKDLYPIESIFEYLNLSLQDKIFDIVESPFGIDFMSKILKDFVIDDIQCLQTIYIEDIDEEIQQFFIQLIGRILNSNILQTNSATEILNDFAKNNLKLDIDQQAQMWQSIK